MKDINPWEKMLEENEENHQKCDAAMGRVLSRLKDVGKAYRLEAEFCRKIEELAEENNRGGCIERKTIAEAKKKQVEDSNCIKTDSTDEIVISIIDNEAAGLSSLAIFSGLDVFNGGSAI